MVLVLRPKSLHGNFGNRLTKKENDHVWNSEGERVGPMDWLTVSLLPRAPRSTQTGHKSPVNGVPQTGQARLLFVFTTFAPGASSVVVYLVSHGLHKIIIGGRSEEIVEILQGRTAGESAARQVAKVTPSPVVFNSANLRLGKAFVNPQTTQQADRLSLTPTRSGRFFGVSLRGL
jgi:hypothetical protein